ncbi:hypothetical protein GGF46_003411 [Coemansia sp. RSA 552]|nr:hypothetical protein GGF46_003411 [Coemansia sp. RSA 552]
MSSYEPPPLEAYDAEAIMPHKGGRGGGRDGHGYPGRGPQPLMNPFGSPVAPAAESSTHHPLEGRTVIVFVSGISAGISDASLERILGACGQLDSWKRVGSAEGTQQSFGFCEYKDAGGAACAMRVLSASGGEKEGGWVLPTTDSAAKPQTLKVQVEAGQREALDLCPVQAEYSKGVVEAVEEILRELRAEASEGAPAGGTAEMSGDSKEASARADEAASSDAHDSDNGEDRGRMLEREDEWEKAHAESERRKRYLEASKEREAQMVAAQRDRMERIERNAEQELDSLEERQRLRDDMSRMLSRWDDSHEEGLGEHDYYRDRQRWWRGRKAVRADELELDEADVRRQGREERASSPRGADDIGESGQTARRRALIEGLIQEIPADPAKLFQWPVKWEYVDAALVQSKIEPVVRKRLVEYLGGDDDDGSAGELAEYVTTHIQDHKPPEGLVDELKMVLVDEAPVFVARIWRFVVYESEVLARNVT